MNLMKYNTTVLHVNNNTKYQLTGVGKLKQPDTGKWYICAFQKNCKFY